MTRLRFTLDDARKLDHGELLKRCDALLQPYEAKPPETPAELEARISRTLDELPDIYGWFKQLHSYFDHWTDFYAAQGGTGKDNLDYKAWRQKRDLMENMASAAKLRYEGTSRRLTQMTEASEEARMPRTRG